MTGAGSGREPDRNPDRLDARAGTGGGRGNTGGGERRGASTTTQRDFSRSARGDGSDGSRSTKDRANPGTPWSGNAELEELPAQPVMARGVPRPGLSGAIVVAVMVGLLAAGFGVLGGRPGASPEPTVVAVASISLAAPTPELGSAEAPLVTPWVECGPYPNEPPEVLLEVNGRTFEGTPDVPSGGSSGGQPVGSVAPSPIDVATDEITELWIGDASCAVGWTIEGPGSEPIASVANPGLNPAYAAQNRFELPLAPYEGLDFELRASFVFPTLEGRWTWLIHVLPVPRPTGILRSSDSETSAVEGCNVVLTLGNGWQDRAECDDDMKDQPIGSVRVAPGAPLDFGFEGWVVMGVDIACGRLLGLSFAADPNAGCPSDTQPSELVSFIAPAAKGRWTLAISGCVLQGGSVTSNTVCGTWYANVEVR